MAKQAKRLLKEGQNLKNIYEVEMFLGEGAFAEVYRVKHNLFGRQALKIFKVSGSLDEIRVSLEEAVLLSKLGHRGIIRVFDAGVYEGDNENHGYFTMEYIAGGNLFQYWQNHGTKLIPTEESVEIVRQVAEGLALAHQDNPPIVHRDIKPQNILVAYDALGMRICLSDFGLAKHVHPLKLLASVRGTLIYKAPETFSDLSADSCASDVWALGVVLYQLLTNRFPYELGVHEQINSTSFDGKLRSANDFNISVDEKLQLIVKKALQIDPSERYQSAAQLLIDLRKWKETFDILPLAEIPLTDPTKLRQNLSQETYQAVRHAFSVAHNEGDLELACKLLTQVINENPDLRLRYESQLKLWQSGKVM